MDRVGTKRRKLNSPDLTSEGQELLAAAYTGNLDLFKDLAALLARGRDLSMAVDSIRDESYGFGAIHMAAAGGKLQLLKFLVEDLMLKVDTLDGLGQTPLTYAVRNGRNGVVLFLVKHGASPNQACYCGLFTPFHISVAEGYTEATEILLSSGLVNMEQSSINGTAINIAASVGNDKALTLLLHHGANMESRVNDFTPLALALLAPSPKCVKLLVEAGADTKDSLLDSPIMLSANYGLSDFMRRLLKAGVNLNILYNEDGHEDAPMIPCPLCSSVSCHQLAQFAMGCCGLCYCCVQHLLESHPKNHTIGLPNLFLHSYVDLDAEVPGCVHPACPPWWLHRASRMDDQIVFEYRSSDETVGEQMVHSYALGHNEPMVEFS